MADLASIILGASPVSAFEKALPVGQSFSAAIQQKHLNDIRQRQLQQQLAQNQQLFPLQLQSAKAKAQYTPALMQAQIQKALSTGSTSPFAVSANPVTGDTVIYNKATGEIYNVGQQGGVNYVGRALNPAQQAALQTKMQTIPTNVAPHTTTQQAAIPTTQTVPSTTLTTTPTVSGMSNVVASPDRDITGNFPNAWNQLGLGNVPNFQQIPQSLRYRYSPPAETLVNPQTGGAQTFYPATTATVTSQQALARGIGGLDSITDEMMNGMAPYQGGLSQLAMGKLPGNAELQKDIFTYSRMPTDTEEKMIAKAKLGAKLLRYARITNSRNEIAGTASRATIGGKPQEGSQLRAANQLLPNLPKFPGNFPKDLNRMSTYFQNKFITDLAHAEEQTVARTTNPALFRKLYGNQIKPLPLHIPQFSNTKAGRQEFLTWYYTLSPYERTEYKHMRTQAMKQGGN